MSRLSVLVNKLGHELEEIRLRALCTLISKLENGLISEEEIIDKDNLFHNLIKWFKFKNAPAKEEVLKLILRLVKTESEAGVLLLKADPGLAVLREVVDCDVLVQDIINITSKQVNSARYTVSKSDGCDETSKGVESARTADTRGSGSSLSYNQTHTARSTKTVGSQSTLRPSVDEAETRRVEDLPSARTMKTEASLRRCSLKESDLSSQERVLWCLPNVVLVASDLHVISTVLESLRSSSQSSVSQTCHFFTSVMLRDFPPQVFLQNPGVVWQLLSLLRSSSHANSAVECLANLTQLLLEQLIFCSQLEFTTNKYLSYGSEEDSTPRDLPRQYQAEGQLSGAGDFQASRDPGSLSLPQYCLTVLTAAAQLLGTVPQASPLALRTLRLLSAVVPDPRCLLTHPRLSELLRALLDVLATQVKQSVSHKTVVELHIVAVTLQVVDTLVPVDMASAMLPSGLQEILCFLLIDPMLSVNFPQLHNTAKKFADVLERKGTQVFRDLTPVMQAMTAGVTLSRDLTSLAPSQALSLFRESLPALPFHRNLAVIEELFQYILERPSLTEAEVEQVTQVTVALLAHSDAAVASETYRVCHNLVTSLLGPRQALSDLDPGPRLFFLMQSSVLVEITCFGVTSSDNRIQQNAEDILTHLLKCQLLVSERWWRRLLEQLSPVLPLLQCHTSKTSPLGRAVLHMLDPDIANCAILTSLQVLLGNARLLFHKDPVVREEAVTRLLWLTGLTEPHNKRLADLCVLDVAVTGHTPVTGMYEASSVVRVLELVSAPCVEARVRQSAITQLSVMTEDSRLHQVFIDNRGVQLFTSLFSQVMEEMNEDAGSFIIPIVATLKHLARHNSTIRQNLSQHEPFLMCLLKSMFQLSEWRLQRDGAQLLALLLYADLVLTCATSVSLPHLVTQNAHLPFPCQTHWTVSPHSTPSLRGVVLGEMGAERLLSAHWAVLTRGLVHLLEQSEVTDCNSPLALSQRTLRQLQDSNVPFGCRRSLHAFQNATSHEAALQALADLTAYLELGWLSDSSTLASLPWKNTFKKFLLTPPSGQDDFNLLFLVLKFLLFLLEVMGDQRGWVTEALLSPPHTLLQLITVANSANHDHHTWKKICLSTLAICKRCLHCEVGHTGSSNWQVVVSLILRCLCHSHTQEYYSLALLDSKLEVLLAALDRHQSADSAGTLWQLLSAFHCESSHSFMGLSITRQTLLCLNKMLALTQAWEPEWLGEGNVRWLLCEEGLCASRDVVVRAASLCLLCGLARTPRGAATLLALNPGLPRTVLGTVVDHTEASVVREYAALLLTNIVKNSSSEELSDLAREVNLYQEFREAVSLVALTPAHSHIEPSSGLLHTDARFVKAGCWLVTNLLLSGAGEDVLSDVCSSGLFTSLCRVVQSVETLPCRETAGLVAAVCRLLAVCCGAGCDIPQLSDCAAALMAFLDPACFGYDPADSSEEAQSLWQETLRLLSHVLATADAESVSTSLVVSTDPADSSEEAQSLWQETLRLLSHVLATADADAEVVLSPAAVTVLSLCVGISDPQCFSLRLTALQAVPVLSKFMTPNSEAALCESLVATWDRVKGKTKTALLAALTALLDHSKAATATALSLGLVASVVTRLRELHLTLTVQTTSTEKLAKKDPRMTEVLQLLELLTAALRGSEDARRDAATHGAADAVHKVWAWCHADDRYLLAALGCLVTLTADSPTAAGTLVLTSVTPGAGLRRSPTAHSLAHAVVAMVTREQHSSNVTAGALTLLRHCCQSQDARCLLAKSSILSKWSDLLSDRRQISEQVESHWFQLILTFTFYPEGQLTLPKTGELFTQLVMCAESGRTLSRARAVAILRNLVTHPANKPRLLSNKRVLQALGEVLLTGGEGERRDAALVVWALAANSQKAKVALRSAGLAQRLRLASASVSRVDNDLFSTVADMLQPR